MDAEAVASLAFGITVLVFLWNLHREVGILREDLGRDISNFREALGRDIGELSGRVSRIEGMLAGAGLKIGSGPASG